MHYDRAMQTEIIFYTSQTCPYCEEMRHWMREQGWYFIEKPVDSDAQAASELVHTAGDQVVPVTVVRVGNASPQVVIGFDRQRLHSLMGML